MNQRENRITRKFAELRKAGRKALVGYLTAGDPDQTGSLKNMRTAIRAGVDVLEIGMPFSDPTADGPAIQEASQRALAGGMNLRNALAIVRSLRRDTEIPIILFGYTNPLLRYGFSKIAADAVAAGVDGFLVVDLPWEEAGEFRSILEARNAFMIPLIAPTTTQKRAAKLLQGAHGFVYYITVTGVTGARKEVAPDLSAHIRQLRRHTDLPVVAGFGISNGRQARIAAAETDGVVVGSALVQAARAGRIVPFVSELRAALDR